MSVEALYWALEQSDLKPGPWRVLMLLADSANKESGCVWLKSATICRRSGMSRSSVLAHIKELHSKGYIVPGDKRFVAHMRADERPRVWIPNTGRGTTADMRGQVLPFADEPTHDDGVQNLDPVQKLDPAGSKNRTSRGPESGPRTKEQEPTRAKDSAQGDRPTRARMREVTDLGASLPGAVPPSAALDHVAACRAAIRKESQ